MFAGSCGRNKRSLILALNLWKWHTVAVLFGFALDVLVLINTKQTQAG